MIALLAGLALATAPKPPRCAESPKRVGPCFTVTGKMRAGNGNPSVRIRPAGTKRLLGVVDTAGNDEDPWLPDGAWKILKAGDAAAGDFTVCPFTADAPGIMRRVCVDAVANLKSAAY